MKEYKTVAIHNAYKSSFVYNKSGTNTNVQNAVRRTNTVQRSSLEFAKAGKIVNAGIKYLTISTIIFQSALYEPASRLSALGRLII